MKDIHIDREIRYDGTQLCSHWIYRTTGLLGTAIASFVGPAEVPLAHMVDLVDVREQAPIASKSMLHFLVEHFEENLALAIARQRLLAAIAAEELRSRAEGHAIERRGDDLYEGDRKISVSIATASPVSCLIHFAMNIVSDGTPVPTKGLADYGLDPRVIADAIRKRYCDEIDSMRLAKCKVRAVE
jgi:uncharacterized protein